MAPVGIEFVSPDYERLFELDKVTVVNYEYPSQELVQDILKRRLSLKNVSG